MACVYDEVDAAYAATCSDGTLCAGARGFFRPLADELCALAPPELMDKLPTLPECNRVTAVIEEPQVMSALSEVLSRVIPLHRGKEAGTAQARREAAQAAFESGEMDKALALASQAVLRAPPTDADDALDGGISLALALWQRSEILLATGRARAALADLRLALKEHLPARMRASYYWRMGHCYKGTGEPTRAKVSYELASRLLGKDEAARAQIERDLAALDFSAIPTPLPQKAGITVTGGAKQNMPALSKLVKIHEEETKGRHAVANSSVKTGDVLLVDTPYAACLVHDYYGTHCLHCFKRLDEYDEEAPMWCPKCAGVAFCSCQCRDAAVSTYHNYECQFLDLFIGSGMSILSHIALRMVTQAGLDASLSIHSKYISSDVKTVESSALNDIEGTSKKSKMKSRKERLNRAKKGVKMMMAEKNAKEDSDVIEEEVNLNESLEMKAAQIYSLCTHAEQRKGEDYLKKIVMGMFLTECLKKGGFFKKCESEGLRKAEKNICELIVRNLQLLQFNAHELYETLRGRHQFTGSKPRYIAVGIYPTGALFNHECYPAVARYFEGKKLVLRATRPLEPGEVVSENYGPHFLVRNFKERQRALTSRYWFRCDCRACREDWPSLKQMPADAPPYLRCPNSSCTWKFKANPKALPSQCAKCNVDIDKSYVKCNVDAVQNCLTLYQEGARLMEEECTEDATRALCEGVDGCVRVAAPPHRDTHLAQEALRSCYAAKGNVHRVKDSDIKSN